MAQISRDEIKKRGFGRFLKSFKYSIDGLVYAYKYEQSMMIHCFATICVIAVNIIFHVAAWEWLLTLVCIGMVLSAELINTAMEAVVDLVTLEQHPLAKIAKDCTSAATFILAMMALIIGVVIYVPHFIDFLEFVGVL